MYPVQTHAGQHLFDVHVHVVAVGGVHNILQGIVLCQQVGVIGLGSMRRSKICICAMASSTGAKVARISP